MNCLEYLTHQLEASAIDSFNIDSLLDNDSGAGDGSTDGSILEECPVDSACGQDVATCLTHAVLLMKDIDRAFGNHKPYLFINILEAAIDASCSYIRG